MKRKTAVAVAVAVAIGSPGGAATLIVLNKADATASLIDLERGATVTTLPTGQGPHEGAVSPDGRLALVANYGGQGAPGSSLTVIDVAQGRVTSTVSLGEYRRPHGLAWIDNRRAAVTAEAQKALLVVDVEKGTVEGAVVTNQDVSHMVALDKQGRAWVASIGSGSASVVDLAARKLVATIPTGRGAEGIDVTPDGAQAWVTNREDGTVTVIDTATLKPVATLKAGSFPIRAKATPDGRHVLVSNARSGDLSVFDVKERKEVRRVRFDVAAKGSEGRFMVFAEGSTPIGIVVAPDGKQAFVAHAGADAVSVIDLGSWTPTGRLAAGKEPDGMAYSPLSVATRPSP